MYYINANLLPTWHTRYSSDSTVKIPYTDVYYPAYEKCNYWEVGQNYTEGDENPLLLPKCPAAGYSWLKNGTVMPYYLNNHKRMDENCILSGTFPQVKKKLWSVTGYISPASSSSSYRLIRTNTTLKIGSKSYTASDFKDNVIPRYLLVIMCAGGGGGGGSVSSDWADGCGGGSGGTLIGILDITKFPEYKIRCADAAYSGLHRVPGAHGKPCYIEGVNEDKTTVTIAIVEGGGGGETDDGSPGAGGNSYSTLGSTFWTLTFIPGASGGKGGPGGTVSPTNTNLFPITDELNIYQTSRYPGGSCDSGNNSGGGGGSPFGAGGDGGSAHGDSEATKGGIGAGGGGARWWFLIDHEGGHGGPGHIEIYY